MKKCRNCNCESVISFPHKGKTICAGKNKKPKIKGDNVKLCLTGKNGGSIETTGMEACLLSAALAFVASYYAEH